MDNWCSMGGQVMSANKKAGVTPAFFATPADLLGLGHHLHGHIDHHVGVQGH